MITPEAREVYLTDFASFRMLAAHWAQGGDATAKQATLLKLEFVKTKIERRHGNKAQEAYKLTSFITNCKSVLCPLSLFFFFFASLF